MAPPGLHNPENPSTPTAPAPPPGLGGLRDPADEPLLTVKLTVPVHAGAGVVIRQRLLDRLTQGARGPLTVITGSAGAGKTALAASWTLAGAAPGPVAWVSLDADDRPGTFWAYVLGAFRHCGVALDGDIAAPARADGVDHSLLVRLAASFERLRVPAVLVVDGMEKLSGPDVPLGLRFLIEHAGPNLRLVVLGRDDPPLPLHRYRAEGRLCEIRGGDLAFTPDEAAALLGQHGLEPGRDVVEALVRRTEGWAAGLRLCALVMARYDEPSAFVGSFSASEHAVADYLLAEVLDTQPPGTRELLLRTSILDQVHPDLADALTARRGAERILMDLARAHAFVEPVADTGWYRFHPLFAEVLRAHLRSQHPDSVLELHRCAARWLAGSGRTAAALEHAVAGGDWQFAATHAVQNLMVGRFLADADADADTDADTGSLAHLFARMPADTDGTAPALVAAASCLHRHDTVACRRWLTRAEEAMRREHPQPGTEARLTCALLRLLSEPFPAHDSGGACEPDRQVALLRAQLSSATIDRHPEIEALRLYGRACAHLRAGRLGEARTAFAETLGACSDDATHVVRHRAAGLLALAESIEGALSAADEHGRACLAIADRHGIPQAQRSGAGHLALAAVAAQRGDVPAAAGHLAAADELPDTRTDPVLVVERSVLRSGIDIAKGRGRPGPDDLAEPCPCSSAWLTERRAVAQATAAVAHGDPATALTVLERVDHDGSSRTLALAQAHLAAGHLSRARTLLTGLDGTTGLNLPDRVRLSLLRSRAALLDGDRAAAHDLLVQAVDEARSEGLLQPFKEAGPWVRRLLTDHGDLRATGDRLTAGSPRISREPALIEELSPRERQVLAEVARLMSTDEIAAELGVSANTVKTHLRSVFRKLCVTRRREAVDRARQLNIL